MRRWLDRESARRRRAGAVAITVALLVLVGVAPASSAPAQPAGTLVTAKAVAIVANFVPSMGALKLAITSGVSVAELRNKLAQSQSQFLDFGLIGASLTAIPCENDDVAGQEVFGDDPAISPSDLPQPTRVDNREGDAAAEAREADTPGGMVAGGVSQVHATMQPLAEAVSTSSRVAAGTLVLNGGRATATTAVVDGGAARLARAGVVVDVEIPGILRLSGLRWDALHRTGTGPAATGTFSFGAAEVLGQSVPVAGIPADQVVDALNEVLGPLGLALGAPAVRHFTEPSDFVRVTPLRLRFGDSPLGSLVFSPILGATQELRHELIVRLHEEQCRTADADTVAQIALGQLSGVGSTVIDVGGVEVTSASVAITNPFGDGGLLPPSADLLPLDLATPGSPPGPGAPTAQSPATGSTGRPALTTRPVGAVERVCESVHPFRWPSCSSGAAPLVGLVALAATVGIGFLDWRHQRRRSRTSGAAGAVL